MTPRRSDGFVRMPDAEFDAILIRAAEEGAARPPMWASTATRLRSTSGICNRRWAAIGWCGAA